MKYDSTRSAEFPIAPERSVPLVNQNSLLTDYPGGIGGKIGWTIRAEATYIGLARRGGKTLIVTVLHCTPLQEITSAERLLNWGFKMDGKVKPVGVLVAPLSATPTADQAAAKPAAQPAAKTAAQHAAKAAAKPGTSARAAAPLGAAASPANGAKPIGGLAIAGGLLAAAGVIITRRGLARRRAALSGRHRND